jgi:8-oxo-dGTP diphosphatase
VPARVHDCVGALVVKQGAVLLGQRSDDCDWLAGAWDVFGGHVEPGESGEQALVRELDEELGIVPTCLEYLDCIDGPSPEPWRLRLYVVTQWQGEPENRQEHAQVQWCSLGQAQLRLAQAHAQFPQLLARAMDMARKPRGPISS